MASRRAGAPRRDTAQVGRQRHQQGRHGAQVLLRPVRRQVFTDQHQFPVVGRLDHRHVPFEHPDESLELGQIVVDHCSDPEVRRWYLLTGLIAVGPQDLVDVVVERGGMRRQAWVLKLAAIGRLARGHPRLAVVRVLLGIE